MKRKSSVEKAVERGAKALTLRYSPVWLNKVQLKTLDIKSTTLCILGQLNGEYFQGLRELGPGAQADPFIFGFAVRQRPGRGIVKKDASELAHAWKRYILRARKTQRLSCPKTLV